MTQGSIQRLYTHLKNIHLSDDKDTFYQHQEQVLFSIILSFSFFAGIAYLPSVYAAYIAGFTDIIIVDTVIYLGVLFLLFKQKLSYKTRAIGIIIPIVTLAIFLLWKFGAMSAGFMWLGLGPVLATLLLSWKAAFILWLLYFPLLLLLSFTTNIQPNLHDLDNLLFWALMSGNFLLISGIISLSIHVLISGLHHALIRESKQITELALTKAATIETVSSLAEYRDSDTGHHIKRTQNYVRVLAQNLFMNSPYSGLLDKEIIELLYQSAPLHDIGKVGVADRILLKPGKLTAEEFKEMKHHAKYGYDALKKSEKTLGHNSFLNLAAEIAYSHHEKWNGLGYPLGLKGTDIPLSGRIMAVADVYDALINKRCYKSAMPHSEAMKYILSESGKHFDPIIVNALIAEEKQFMQIANSFSDQ